MPFLRVYAGDTLVEQHELVADRLRIGRASDNDVVLDNPGVSKHHALIERHGNSFVLLDNDSANGVFVNGSRVKEHTLKFWDEIQIFPHKLVFMALAKLPGQEEHVGSQEPAMPEDRTCVLGADQVSDILLQLKQAQSKHPSGVPTAATLVDDRDGSEYRLGSERFRVGRSRDCALRCGGWFAPKYAAAIEKRGDGWHLIPEPRAKTLVNGVAIKDAVKLADNDALQIQGRSLRFLATSKRAARRVAH